MRSFGLILLLAIGLSACHKKSRALQTEKVGAAAPVVSQLRSIVVYKTNANYRWKVPAEFDKASGTFSSYPAPSDMKIFIDSGNALPLKSGYLLDLAGISAKTVFFKYDIKKYSELKQVPDEKSSVNDILSQSPIDEICICKTPILSNDMRAYLNRIIANDSLSILFNCQQIKN